MKTKRANRKVDPRGFGLTISAYVSPEIYKRLVAAAAADRRSVSNVIEYLVEQGLPRYEAKISRKEA